MFSNGIKVLATTLIAAGYSLVAAAPDLSVQWVEVEARPGDVGTPATLRYRIKNLGDEDAFAVLLQLPTRTPGHWRTIRLSPGPAAGHSLERSISADLLGQAALPCVCVQLQTINTNDPPDMRPENNRICLESGQTAPGQQVAGGQNQLDPGEQ